MDKAVLIIWACDQTVRRNKAIKRIDGSECINDSKVVYCSRDVILDRMLQWITWQTESLWPPHSKILWEGCCRHFDRPTLFTEVRPVPDRCLAVSSCQRPRRQHHRLVHRPSTAIIQNNLFLSLPVLKTDPGLSGPEPDKSEKIGKRGAQDCK